MKKLSKAILLAVGALLVLVVFGLFCVNLYIQSPHTQAQIQEQLSRSLHMPLKITNTSLTPWSGLRITGITIPHGDANFLEAGSFVANYRALPLFGGRLVIPELRVEEAKVVWIQNAEGRWKMPTTRPPKDPNAPKEEKPAEKTDKKEEKSGGINVVVERFLVKNATVDLIDKDGTHTAVLTGVNVDFSTLTEELAEGVATIDRAIWAETLALENVRSSFKYTQTDFTLPDLTATLGGGPVKGNFHGQPEAPKSPFETSLTFDSVNLDRVSTEAGWKSGQISGIAAGKLDLHGDMHRAERAEGTGQIELREGRFQELELFETIGKALNLQELSDLRLKDAQGDFHVGGEKVIFDRLTLRAANLQLDAKGQIRFDKKVNMEAQLGVDEELWKKLPDLVRASFAAANGQHSIDFAITGSTDKLRTNLLEKLIGQKIGQQLDDFLTGIFGDGNKKEEEEKKKKEEERKKAEKAEKARKKKEADAAKKAAAAAAGATPAPAPAPAIAPGTPAPGPASPPTTTITPAKP